MKMTGGGLAMNHCGDDDCRVLGLMWVGDCGGKNGSSGYKESEEWG